MRSIPVRTNGRDANPTARDERGAVLVLAMFWLVACSLLITTLLTFTGTALVSVRGLHSTRSTEYAATGAMDLSIQTVRYNYNSYSSGGASPCSPGLSNVVTITSNKVVNKVVVLCSGVYSQYSLTGATRTITFTACAIGTVSAGHCAQPLASAIVVFDDFSATDQYNCSSAGTTTCGTGMTIQSWDLF